MNGDAERFAGISNSHRLTREEINELARLFDKEGAARRLLLAAGLSATRFPTWYTAMEFWHIVARRIEAGIGPDGRQRLLAAALAEFPGNPVLRQALWSESIGEAYRAYQADLLRFVRRRMAAHSLSEAQVDAEGVVQETFELATKHWSTIDNPPAWLFTVARRLVSNAARTPRPAAADSSTLDETAARWSTAAPRASPEDARAAREVLDAIAVWGARSRPGPVSWADAAVRLSA